MDKISCTDLLPYQPIAQKLAKAAMRRVRGDLDCLGNDVSDYQSLLMHKAWKAVCVYRAKSDRIGGKKGEHSFVCCALWNTLKDYDRSRRKAVCKFQIEERDWLDVDWGNRMNTRIWASEVQAKAPSSQWDALMEFLEFGYSSNRSNRYQLKKLRNTLVKTCSTVVMP